MKNNANSHPFRPISFKSYIGCFKIEKIFHALTLLKDNNCGFMKIAIVSFQSL